MAEPQDIFEALFVGDDVANAEIARAARAAQDDSDLRDLFNGLADADEALGGDFEARAGEAWFLDSLDAMLAEEAPAEVVTLADRRPRYAAWAAAAAAIVAVGGAVVMQQPQTSEFQPRSAVTTQKAYDEPTVDVFCVERTDTGVKFVGAEQSEFATVRCAVDQEIKFAVRNPDLRLRYMALIGVQSDDSFAWYGPSPAAKDVVSAPHSTEPAPVGETIRLDVNHEPGTVRVVGVFTEEPLTWSELKKWAQDNAGALRDGQLNVSGGIAVRQTFEVTP